MKRLTLIVLLGAAALAAKDKPKPLPKPNMEKLYEIQLAQKDSVNQGLRFADLQRQMDAVKAENAKTVEELKRLYNEIFDEAGLDKSKYGIKTETKEFVLLPPDQQGKPAEAAKTDPPKTPEVAKQPVPVKQDAPKTN